MASTQAQRKWRDRNRFTKRQLNVMARKRVHDTLDDLAGDFDLRGKGEAVAFAVYVTTALQQQTDFNEEAARLLEVFAEAYRRDREFFAD